MATKMVLVRSLVWQVFFTCNKGFYSGRLRTGLHYGEMDATLVFWKPKAGVSRKKKTTSKRRKASYVVTGLTDLPARTSEMYRERWSRHRQTILDYVLETRVVEWREAMNSRKRKRGSQTAASANAQDLPRFSYLENRVLESLSTGCLCSFCAGRESATDYGRRTRRERLHEDSDAEGHFVLVHLQYHGLFSFLPTQQDPLMFAFSRCLLSFQCRQAFSLLSSFCPIFSPAFGTDLR